MEHFRARPALVAVALAALCSVGVGCGDKLVNATSTLGSGGAAGTMSTGGAQDSGASGAGNPLATAGSGGTSSAGTTSGSSLPKRLFVGWGAQDYKDTWAEKSGTQYDVQWLYLTGQSGNNWYNGFTYSPADGSFLDDVLTTVDGHGFIPGIHLYNMGYGHDQGDSGLLTEIQDPNWTKNYFSEFKIMLQKIKDFGKPVIIVLEGDSFGMIEIPADVEIEDSAKADEANA